MCGKDDSTDKTQSQQQTTAPLDPAVKSAYDTLLAKGQSLSEQPLQTYGGPLVAGLTSDQQTAIGQIKNAGSLAAPYLTEAAGYANQSASPISLQDFSPDAVNQYLSPYLDQVLKSSMAMQNEQDAEQQQQLQGNITAAGAWGGDRSAVVQSELARQQALANNQTNAGIENQGYASALAQFNTQNQQSLQTQQANKANQAQAGYSLGNIGTAMQNSALTGASALLNAGTLEQQLNQENLNVPYEQFMQQQAYPYQSLQFMASLLPGIAQGTGISTSGSGTSTSNTTPGWYNFLKSGGRTSLADGGFDGDGWMPEPAVPNAGMSYIPAMGGNGNGSLASPSMNMNGGSGDGQGGGGGGNSLSTGFLSDFGDGLKKGMGMDDIGAKVGDMVSKGATAALAMFGLQDGGRTKLADGGDDDSDPGDEGNYAGPSGASAMSLSDTPPEWRDKVTNYAPDAPAPSWDDGEPVIKNTASDDDAPDAGGASLAGPSPSNPRTIWEAPAPNIWHSVLSGIGQALSHRSIGAGLSAGVKDYDEQMDAHPEVDHSGASIMVKYGAPGQKSKLIDTGIPTEAALNAKAMNSYRLANMDMTKQTREDAIGQRADAAADRAAAATQAAEDRRQAAADRAANSKASIDGRRQADADRASYQKDMADLRRDQLNQGKFSTPVPGMGVDSTGKAVPGAYTTDLKTGEPVFHPGVVLQARTAPRPTSLNVDQAMGFAQRDYDRMFPVPKADPNNPGAALPPRPFPQEGMQTWMKKRAGGYMDGSMQPPAAGATPATAGGPPPRNVVPQRPATVPQGAQYSPSRQMWRDLQGRLYSAQGQPQ